MPRQKFCSVPGCLSTTDSVKREQESFLSAYCDRCSSPRPCRCPAPDIYTTRRETRTKFNAWCSAIGLKDPGYYINVCHKHFSAGCPSRTCPNPDAVVTPAWEKHVKRDRVFRASETEASSPTAAATAVAAASSKTAQPATVTAAPFPCRKMARPVPPTAVAASTSTSTKGRAPNSSRTRGYVARPPLNNNSLKMRPTLKRSIVIERRTPLPQPPPPPPPLVCRSSSTGSNSSACSSASSSPVSSNQPPLPVSSPPLNTLPKPKPPTARTLSLSNSAGSAVTAPSGQSGAVAEQSGLQRPPPDIPALLSSIVQRQNRLHNSAGPPPQCFLTLNPPSPPLATVREATVLRLGGRPASPSPSPTSASLPSPQQQPDLRKLQPLPLSSIKIEIEPDLKKLTPVPISEKELSCAPTRPHLPILVTNVVKNELPPSHIPAPQALIDSVFTSGPISTDASLPMSIPITFTTSTGMDLQEINYDGDHGDGHAMASLMKEDSANDEDIRVVLLDEGNGLLDQSEDPCLNDGNRAGSNFASRSLADSPFGDESVQKWLEICEA